MFFPNQQQDGRSTGRAVMVTITLIIAIWMVSAPQQNSTGDIATNQEVKQ